MAEGEDPNPRPFIRRPSFQWDENKRRANLTKHGIDFLDALQVFNDERGIVYRSPVVSEEERHVAVGMAGDRCLAVVFTLRGENVVRIVSARRARKNEQKRHEAIGEG